MAPGKSSDAKASALAALAYRSSVCRLKGENMSTKNWTWMIWKIVSWALAILALSDLEAQPRIKLATEAPTGGSVHHALLVAAQKLRNAPCGGVTLTSYL